MKPSEYKAEIERIYGWEINESMLNIFIDLAKRVDSGALVLKEWATFQKIYKKGSPYKFLVWFDGEETKQADLGMIKTAESETITNKDKSTKQIKNDGMGLFDGLPWRGK